MVNRKEIIAELLEQEQRDGYVNGIAEGYAVAQRIFVWFATNHQLKEPKTIDELQEWSRKELDGLRSKLDK
jgi:hypothetical protein